jgi:hypothetical protein
VRVKLLTFFRNLLKLVFVSFALVLMVGFAKATQSASVDAFGAQLGFEVASLLALMPCLILFYFVSKKLPSIKLFGRSYG